MGKNGEKWGKNFMGKAFYDWQFSPFFPIGSPPAYCITNITYNNCKDQIFLFLLPSVSYDDTAYDPAASISQQYFVSRVAQCVVDYSLNILRR